MFLYFILLFLLFTDCCAYFHSWISLLFLPLCICFLYLFFVSIFAYSLSYIYLALLLSGKSCLPPSLYILVYISTIWIQGDSRTEPCRWGRMWYQVLLPSYLGFFCWYCSGLFRPNSPNTTDLWIYIVCTIAI